jgi:hypothetical protein
MFSVWLCRIFVGSPTHRSVSGLKFGHLTTRCSPSVVLPSECSRAAGALAGFDPEACCLRQNSPGSAGSFSD